MPPRNPVTKNLAPARYTLRYADIDDDDAIKTAVATVAADTTYTGADLNGALANPGPALTKMHRLTVTTSSNAGSYTIVDPIVATCTDQYGATRSLEVTLTAVNGGEVLEFALENGTDAGALTVSSIAIPAMNDTGGQFEFGVSDVVFDEPCRQLRCGAAGDIVVNYEAESISGTAIQDTLTGIEGERHDVFCKRILDDSGNTDAFPITAYI